MNNFHVWNYSILVSRIQSGIYRWMDMWTTNTHSLSHVHTYTPTVSLTHSYTHTVSRPHAHMHPYGRAHTHLYTLLCHVHTPTQSHARVHITNTLSRALTNSYTLLCRANAHTPTQSHAHKCTHTLSSLSRSRAHTHANAYVDWGNKI
jgi:hypothetical protein